MLCQPQQPVLLLLGEAADRDAGLPGHHLGDRLGLDDEVLALVDLAVAAGLGDPLLHIQDPVAQLGGLLVLLVRDRLVLVQGQLLELPLQGPYVRALGPGPQPHPGTGLVDQVDGLVRQAAVGEITVGQLHGRHQRLVGVADLVVGLVAVPQAAQDLDRVRGGRLRDHDRLEAAGQRRVLLDPAVLLQGGGAHDVQLAAGEGRLEDVAGVHRTAVAATGTGAHDRVQLVDEDDQLLGVGADLTDDVVHPLLEVTPVAGARDHARQVQGDHAASAQYVGHVPLGDALRQPLHDGGLADARVTDQHGVVLAAAGEDLDGLLDLLVPADHRVDAPLPCQFGEVAAVLVQGRRVRRARPLGLGDLRRLGRGGRREAGRVQDVPGGRVGVRGQGAEHVLRADVAVAAGPGHVVRVQQGPFGGRGEGQRGRRRCVLRAVLGRARPVVDLRRQRVGIGPGLAEQGPGGLGGERRPQQMLRVEVPAAVLGGVLGGAADELPGRLAEQPPEVDLPGTRTRSAEEACEEFSEGVRAVALRAGEAAAHGPSVPGVPGARAGGRPRWSTCRGRVTRVAAGYTWGALVEHLRTIVGSGHLRDISGGLGVAGVAGVVQRAVRILGPESVIATVCSAWAAREPSFVFRVQPSGAAW